MSLVSLKYVFKCIIVGEVGTGKSSISIRLIDKEFATDYKHTMGVEFGVAYLNIGGTVCRLNIWDTAGQERFKSITRSYFRGSNSCILVYDITNRESFNQIPNWLATARSHSSDNCVFMLIGNKMDEQSKREVTFLEASRFAQENDLLFIETSAKTGENIEEAFMKCAKTLLTRIESGKINLDDYENIVSLDSTSNDKKSCC